MESVTFVNRKTREKIVEQIPSAGMLKFLYSSALGKASLQLLFKRKIVSSIGGWYMNSKGSKNKIENFIKEYNMDMSEYICPENGFSSFNDFFYRKIKPEARPIGDGVVSPADGKLLAFNTIKESNNFFIKGSEFTAKSFLKDETLAKKYENGAMVIIRLAPVDYHRFHMPASGEISESKLINGDYYSVSPLALKKSLEIFCENIREYSILKTSENGDILVSEVGATMVGSIIQTYKPNTKIEKGSEKGYFAFGGSTLVLFFEEGKVKLDEDLIENTKNGFETVVKMGEKIGI
ncbi:phosphatidylserine decarboxylase [Aureivirga sp. CE67]|uniref:phosphatidylserine decarboxylase n=1 Tax=Aureivirga sp. CE67 TaxID=1788983 RepID=UPI0018C921B6|nr:phosphatidylserine decarboxylase [Aureivirga sp. CE67]